MTTTSDILGGQSYNSGQSWQGLGSLDQNSFQPYSFDGLGTLSTNWALPEYASLNGAGTRTGTGLAQSEPGFFDQPTYTGANGATVLGNSMFQNVLGGAMGLGNLFMGYKNYGLAKKTFDFQTKLAKTNLANQNQVLKADLADRTASRLAFNPNNAATEQGLFSALKLIDMKGREFDDSRYNTIFKKLAAEEANAVAQNSSTSATNPKAAPDPVSRTTLNNGRGQP